MNEKLDRIKPSFFYKMHVQNQYVNCLCTLYILYYFEMICINENDR